MGYAGAMLLLTLVCALISAAAVAVAVLWHRLMPDTPALAHEKALYAGYVADVERRLAAGEVDADLAHEERVEAGRALLKAQGDSASAPRRPLAGLLVAAGAAGLGFALYLVVGHPGWADQPYKMRLQQWTHAAKTMPDSVPPEIMAVVLRQGSSDPDKARNPVYWQLIGRIDMLAGDAYAGMKDYKTALGLAPQGFVAWSELGEAVTMVAGGRSGPEAQGYFAKALLRDPGDARAHYYLGREAVANRRFDAAREHFSAALAQMKADDPTRVVMDNELKGVDTAQAAVVAANARIEGMVASLAAQLKADPDNPDGWARLLRSYTVLGNAAGHDTAVADMQAHYRDQPQVAAAILSKSAAAVGLEGGG